MNQTKLSWLFTVVQQGTIEFKTQVPDGDGRAFWQPLKKLFGEQDITAREWKKIDPILTEKLMNLPEFDKSGKIIPINHFLRQQVRIPTQEEPSLRRIMQVALNSGQFLASNDSINGLEYFDYYHSGLNCLNTYIQEADLENMSIGIPENLIAEVETYLAKKYFTLFL